MSRPTICEIDLAALRHNFKQVRLLAPNSKILAMIKADAYGHGSVKAARALTDADAFGVACIEEALTLRLAGIKQPVVIAQGFYKPEELVLISQHNFEIVVHNQMQVNVLLQQIYLKPITVWLKINTGMNRLGLKPKQAIAAWQQLKNCKSVKKIRLMTHFSDADDLTKPTMLNQINLFNETISGLLGERTLANSAAILGWPASHADWVRPGIMLYGVSPFAGKTGEDHGLKPVMTLRSEIIAIQELKKGEMIGYGGTWMSPQDMRIGVVAIGYADGYPRSAVNGTPVLVNDQLTQIAGRVSMDMITVDLQNQPTAKIGDPVVLWGKGLPAEVVSKYSNRFEYELLCGVAKPRLTYVYLD